MVDVLSGLHLITDVVSVTNEGQEGSLQGATEGSLCL